MKRSFNLIAAILFMLSLSGCGANLMKEASIQQLTAPAPAKAKVVFMRNSFVAGGVGCDMFEVVNGELKYIGQLPTGNKVVYEVTPGSKVFMAYGTAADFMLADLQPGKTYYSIVRPNWGTGGFAPTPIRHQGSDPVLNSPELKSWISGTKLLETDQAKAQAWLDKNHDRLQQIYTEYWARFQHKSGQEKAERTMQAQDGE